MFSQMTDRPATPRGGGPLIATLALAGISVSLMQTLVIPIVPQLPVLLGTSAANASWAVTATLLTGAVATPTFGRLGDMFGAKRILIACAAILTIGSIIAALTTSLVPLVVGRALQGFGAPVIPLGISVLRAALPADRVGSAMGMLSASLGVGGALGLPLSAVIAEHWGWHALFWCAAGLGLGCALIFVVMVPDVVPSTSMGRFDYLGAVGLAVGLVLLLLPISKGGSWGWTSPGTLGMLAASIAVFVVFGWWQYRARTPLVDLRTTLKRPVLLTNLASVAIGIGMFASSLVGPQLLQMPSATGYGLGQSLVAAGLWMAPSGLAMMAASTIAGRFIGARGPRFTLVLGAVIIAVGYLGATQLLGSPIGVMTYSVICSIGVGFAFAALPTLINAAVPVSETAAANGFNTLARSLGTSISSAVIGAVLAQMTIVYAGQSIPSLTGFRTAFLIAGGAAVVAALIAATIPSSVPAPASAAEPVLLPSAVRRRAQRLEDVMTALDRQAAVRLEIPAPHRLDRGDYVMAAYLGGAASLTMEELADALDTATESVEERLSILIRDGMVTRVSRPGDSAMPRFALTQHGLALFEHHRSTNITGLESILARWDDGDVAALIGYLGRLSDGIDEEYRQRTAASVSAGGDPTQAFAAPLQTQRPLVRGGQGGGQGAPSRAVPRPLGINAQPTQPLNLPPRQGGYQR